MYREDKMKVDKIDLIPGETMIRTYEFMDMDYRPKIEMWTKKQFGKSTRIPFKRKSNAHLIVTNKRLFCITRRANGNNDSQFYQLNIKDVGDINILHAKWNSLLIPLCFIVLGLLLLTSIVGIIPLIIGIWMFMKGKTITQVSIFSKSAMGGMCLGKVSKEAMNEISFTCKPGRDFDKMLGELGTLILDLQTYGDDCIDRWLLGRDSPDTEYTL